VDEFGQKAQSERRHAQGAREGREMAIDAFIAQSHRFQALEAEGRNIG
jgi:hypothetical protein